jgi:hypothetical protein
VVARDIAGKSIATDPSGDEAPSHHEANFQTPGGPRFSTDEHEEVRVVREAKDRVQSSLYGALLAYQNVPSVGQLCSI